MLIKVLTPSSPQIARPRHGFKHEWAIQGARFSHVCERSHITPPFPPRTVVSQRHTLKPVPPAARAACAHVLDTYAQCAFVTELACDANPQVHAPHVHVPDTQAKYAFGTIRRWSARTICMRNCRVFHAHTQLYTTPLPPPPPPPPPDNLNQP